MSSAPFNYVDDMPHDGWRAWLPYSIDMYLYNRTVINTEGVSFWYRPNPAAACSKCTTGGNPRNSFFHGKKPPHH